MFYPSCEYDHYKEFIVGTFGSIKSTQNLLWSNNFVFILFTNRSGSNYLSDLLKGYLELPFFGEALNIEEIANWNKVIDYQSFPEYFVNVLQPENPKIIKISSGQLRILIELGIINSSSLSNEGPKFIESTRLDLVAQAVSHYIASNTSNWSCLESSEARIPSYSYDSILSILIELSARLSNSVILRSMLGLQYPVICYEDLCLDPLSCINRILTHLGMPSRPSGEPLKKSIFTKQTTHSTAIKVYSEIFRADAAATLDGYL